MITVRHAAHTEETCEALSHILIAAWRSGFRGILEESIIRKYTNFPDVKSMFAQILASSIGTMYLAQLDEQPAGLLYFLTEGNTARIEALLTVPAAWGKGVAASLILQAMEDARSAGCTSVRVWPFAENHRARRFYEKHGFHPSGESRMGEAEEMEYLRFL